SRGMLLTAFGQALLPRAMLLEQEALHATQEIDAMRGLAKGTIRVGAIGSVASSILPRAIARVLARWPGLQIEVLEGVWDKLAEALMRHEIDIALGKQMDDSADICAIADCRWTDTSHVVAAAGHPLTRKDRLAHADVLGAQWAMVPRGTAPFQEMSQMFALHGLPAPEIAVQTRSIVVLKSLVIDAGFLSWMAEPMYEAERKAGLIAALPVAGLEAVRTLTAFRRRQGLLPAPAVKLVEELRNVAMRPGNGKTRQ
ncbi:MAG: LysR substrate-binding domain-containing protein, partial [Noviherbaspirillum sp.]